MVALERASWREALSAPTRIARITQGPTTLGRTVTPVPLTTPVLGRHAIGARSVAVGLTATNGAGGRLFATDGAPQFLLGDASTRPTLAIGRWDGRVRLGPIRRLNVPVEGPADGGCAATAARRADSTRVIKQAGLTSRGSRLLLRFEIHLPRSRTPECSRPQVCHILITVVVRDERRYLVGTALLHYD